MPTEIGTPLRFKYLPGIARKALLQVSRILVDPGLEITGTRSVDPHVSGAHIGNVERQQVLFVVWKTRPKIAGLLKKGQAQSRRPNSRAFHLLSDRLNELAQQ